MRTAPLCREYADYSVVAVEQSSARSEVKYLQTQLAEVEEAGGLGWVPLTGLLHTVRHPGTQRLGALTRAHTEEPSLDGPCSAQPILPELDPWRTCYGGSDGGG